MKLVKKKQCGDWLTTLTLYICFLFQRAISNVLWVAQKYNDTFMKSDATVNHVDKLPIK